MVTYRVYVLNTARAEAPVVNVAFVRAEKYGDAWRMARAALNDASKSKALYADVEATKPASLGVGDHVVVAKIDDITPRNAKIDRAALAATLAGEGDAATKLAALASALGVKLPA